ncbi:hypothetical protein XM25_07830 [Devosia sp. H5989]|nr:hypothetical protein XM25_07830 [Devosia sp. H5989]
MADGNRRFGALRYLLSFQNRLTVDDGFGNQVPGGQFETQFSLAAAMAPRTGGESVTAARLQGNQPYVVTVRYSARLADVTPAWRLVDERAGFTDEEPNRFFNIVAPGTDPDGKRQWMEFLVMEGRPS